MKKKLCIVIFLINFFILNAQSVFLSEENNFIKFLELSNVLEVSNMNYRTLSDVRNDFTNFSYEDNLWHNIQFDKTNTITENFSYKIFSPELYMSYNSASPYGINDEALWQGKGFNSEINVGILLKYRGLELTLLPEITFSQNLSFDYIIPNYSGDSYAGKADTYGYYGLTSIDAPQRFGNTAFCNFNFGQSELRYTFKEYTLGFGTQSIWLGPAKINPIIHSNNAASYPKLDFGVRKKSITIKDLWLGNIEFRYWLGYLHESKFFDNDSSNDENLITGLALAYEFPFLEGFTLSFNRTMISKWNAISPYTMFTILVPFMDSAAGFDENDQRASVIANYYIKSGKINLYLEWARNDYNIGLDNLVRYPFHTQAFSFGFDKGLKYTNDLFAEFIFEFSFLESSMDYHFFYDWGGVGNSFYTHHKILQGYTNNGQCLGAGIGSGGNSQYIGFKLYYPKGSSELFLQRANPDLNYSYFQDTDSEKTNEEKKQSIRATMDFGISSFYCFTPKLHSKLSFVFRDEHNPLNENRKSKSIHRYNVHISLWLKYVL